MSKFDPIKDYFFETQRWQVRLIFCMIFAVESGIHKFAGNDQLMEWLAYQFWKLVKTLNEAEQTVFEKKNETVYENPC